MNRIRSRPWRAYEEAREFVRGLGLRNLSEWLAWAFSGAAETCGQVDGTAKVYSQPGF
jgi:hypothetical protein